MKIVVAGGTGFLGRTLCMTLRDRGHSVTVLSRGNPGRCVTSGVAVKPWSPNGSAGDWAGVIDGADAVVNLAGESIAAGRWTPERRQQIRDSRLLATRSLVAAISSASHPPAALINGSAQGYYGDRGDEEVTEESAPGSDFLAQVCLDWEAEARQATSLARVVLLRTGIVLAADEGALPRMLLPFRLFGGGRLGDGSQYMSWIHLGDWVEMAAWALRDERVVGPVNLGTPHPVRNAEFAATLGRVLGRPSWLPTPGFALRAAMGEMADALLLTSTRMRPARAEELGYAFTYPALEPALRHLLARG